MADTVDKSNGQLTSELLDEECGPTYEVSFKFLFFICSGSRFSLMVFNMSWFILSLT